MNSKTLGILLIFLAVFFNFYLRYPFLNIPLERDEGEYAYISNVIADGGLPYKDAFDQKPPAVFYLYYLVFLLFGKKVIALRLFAAFYNLFSVYFVYKIGKLIKGRDLGLISALIFAITSSERRLLGFSANTEIFMLLPSIAGVYYALAYLETKKISKVVVSGILLSISVLFKQPAFFNIVFVLCVLIFYGIINKEEICWHIKTPLLISSAFALPLLLVSIYFYANNGFGEFKYQVFLHNLAYVGWDMPWNVAIKNLIDTLKFILSSQAVFWAMLLAGIVFMILKKQYTKYFAFLLAWFVLSFAAISLGKRFTLHYFEQLMPPLSLIAGTGFFSIASIFSKGKTPKPLLIAVMVFLLIILVPYNANKAYSSYTPEELSYAIYSGNPFNEDVTAAKYIGEKTSKEQTIFVVGSEPQIYFYTGRHSASKYIFFYPLTGGYSNALAKQKEVINDINAKKPEYIIYANYALSLGITPSSPAYIFEEVNKILQGYNLEALVIPQNPNITYTGAELDAIFKRNTDIFNKEGLFIYKRKKQI
jgi:4-amino-4-deoxy-L-arabinose transferase-like glycosyltransferase